MYCVQTRSRIQCELHGLGAGLPGLWPVFRLFKVPLRVQVGFCGYLQLAASTEGVTCVGKVERGAKGVVVLGSDEGVGGVQQHPICPQHLLQLLLELLLLLDEKRVGLRALHHLHHGQSCSTNTPL